MTVVYLEALAAIAVSLAVLMAFAWVVQQRTGNSDWVDLDLCAGPCRRRQRGYRDYQSRTSRFFPLPPQA